MKSSIAALEHQLLELKRQQARDLARSHFANFVQWVNPQYRMQWYHRQIAEVCERVARGRNMRVIINGPPRHGKLCADSTPVLTTTGWKRHGDLRVGDQVFLPSGFPVDVIACSRPGIAQKLVTFTDGSSIKVHRNHEWYVYDKVTHCHKVLETRELGDLWIVPRGRPDSRARYQLPLREPLQFPHNELAADSYAFGNRIGRKLRHCIPDYYLSASIQQRLLLLAGIIDGGCSVDKKGRVRFSSKNPRVIGALIALVRGLGARAGCNRESTGIYRVWFHVAFDVPCRVKHIKRLRVQRQISIAAVEDAPPERGKCIQIDSFHGVYLVGETLIPTHNSELISRKFPAYYLGLNSDKSIIATSYNAELASMMNRDVQRVIDSDRYRELFPDTTLAFMNSRAVAGRALRNSDIFEIVDHAGSYRSAGVGGSVMGLGGDCILIDDPVKNEEEARSAVYRQKIWEWYTNTLLTRQQAGASVLLIMTRWHEDDLVGRLLQRAAEDPTADQWEVICYRAIREEEQHRDDPRHVGDALWPEEYPLKYLQKMRSSMGEANFAGLYQQRPSLGGKAALPEWRWCFWYSGKEPSPITVRDDEGNLVSCHQERLPTEFDLQIQSWDMAFKDLKTSDWVVGGVHAKKGARAFFLDQIRGRFDFPRTVKEVLNMSNRHPRTRAKLIEDKANGPAVISTLKTSVPGLLPINPEGGKEARVNALSYLHEAGNLFIPHPTEAPWVRGFMQECSQFPKGRYDDQIDSYSQAINWLFNSKRKKKWGLVQMCESRW